jgi:hypothetical protein
MGGGAAMADKDFMLSLEQVRVWVERGGNWCPFCQSEQLNYLGTTRSLNALTTVEYSCVSCRNRHYAIYKGDDLVDLTHDQVNFHNRRW